MRFFFFFLLLLHLLFLRDFALDVLQDARTVFDPGHPSLHDITHIVPDFLLIILQEVLKA